MSATYEPNEFPAEFRPFLESFRALLSSHPAAAGRFALADLGAQGPEPRVTHWECRRTEWGIECRRDPRPE